MRRTTFAGLLSLFAVIGIVASDCSARAADCTLTIANSGGSQTIFQPVGGTVPWVNNVTLTSGNSTWTLAVAHFNNLSTSTTYSTSNPNGAPPSSGGSYSFSISFPTSGTYECYMIDSGTASGTPPTWYNSTNHIIESVNVGP